MSLADDFEEVGRRPRKRGNPTKKAAPQPTKSPGPIKKFLSEPFPDSVLPDAAVDRLNAGRDWIHDNLSPLHADPEQSPGAHVQRAFQRAVARLRGKDKGKP